MTHWDSGGGGWGWGFADSLLSLLFIAAIVVGVLLMVRALAGGHSQAHESRALAGWDLRVV